MHNKTIKLQHKQRLNTRIQITGEDFGSIGRSHDANRQIEPTNFIFSPNNIHVVGCSRFEDAKLVPNNKNNIPIRISEYINKEKNARKNIMRSATIFLLLHFLTRVIQEKSFFKKINVKMF